MGICENCKSLDICTGVDKNKNACFFFSPTEEYRIKNSKEYAIGYEQGRTDERAKVISEQKEYIEYILSILTDEQLTLVIEKGEQLKEQSNL